MIVTLDGELWREEELETNMYDDEFYYGYMGKNSLSSSSIKVLASKPNNYFKYVNSTGISDSKFDFGSLFHWYLLEPDVFQKQVFVDVPRKDQVKFGKKLKRNTEKYILCLINLR